MTRRRCRRDGFVLLAVLWVLASASMLAALVVLVSLDASGTAANRVSLTRARWIADGCMDRARAAVDEASGDAAISDSVWSALDRVVLASPLTAGCTLALSPAGVTLDVGVATADQLRRLIVSAGISAATADSTTAAILAWRNADGASLAELPTIGALREHPDVAAMLGLEPGRILLSRAPIPVLATLPGMSAAALAVVEQRCAARDSVLDLARLVQAVPEDARQPLLANLPGLTATTTALPEAWIVASRATVGRPAVTASVELRVVRSGRRLAVMRRRSDS